MSEHTSIPHRVHLVGIGGMHMSAIARILLSRGHEVSGSDIRRTPLTDTLQQLGARVVIGPHDAASLGDAEFVVTTSAATADNPELDEARRRGIPLIKRADMVAKLMEGLTAVCVAGCHGKSTTSGLVAFILEETGYDPTYLIGAEVADLGDNAKPGSGPHVVVEADEYDRAFLSYNPDVALVTNVEADHLDYYKTWEAVQDAFRSFAARVVPGGTLLLCADNDEATALRACAQAGVSVLSYGFKDGSDWQATNAEASYGRQSFTVLHDGQEFGVFSTLLAGRHNVQNALGAIAMCATLGLDASTIAGALTVYTGVRRRFEWVGEENGITVMDDYAHHPTEIEALAESARSRFPGRRIVVCFQPHTFARTRYLLDAFKTCFRNFDRLYLLETYAAREAIADGMTAKQLSEEVHNPEPTYVATFEEAAETIAADLRPGDVFFTVGAGDLDQVGPMVLDHLRTGTGKREQGT
jgi:UDP-N-acetylmuramate--alanine ligase